MEREKYLNSKEIGLVTNVLKDIGIENASSFLQNELKNDESFINCRAWFHSICIPELSNKTAAELDTIDYSCADCTDISF